MTGEATLSVIRGDEYFGSIRELLIYVDDEEVGRIGVRARADLPVTAGGHQVYVRMDLMRSPRVDVDLADGQALAFTVAAPRPPRQGRPMRLGFDLVPTDEVGPDRGQVLGAARAPGHRVHLVLALVLAVVVFVAVWTLAPAAWLALPAAILAATAYLALVSWAGDRLRRRRRGARLRP